MYLWDPIVDDDSSDYIAAVALKLATYERIFAPCRSSTTAGRAGDAQCGFKLSSRGAAHILFPRQHLATRIFNIQRRVLAAHQGVVHPRRRAACHMV